MRKNYFKLFGYLILTIIITLGVSMVSQTVLAEWVPPSIAPPDGNVKNPINVSKEFQVKEGGLHIGGETSYYGASLIVEQGNVAIGVIPGESSNHKLEVALDSDNTALIGKTEFKDHSPFSYGIENMAEPGDIYITGFENRAKVKNSLEDPFEIVTGGWGMVDLSGPFFGDPGIGDLWMNVLFLVHDKNLDNLLDTHFTLTSAEDGYIGADVLSLRYREGISLGDPGTDTASGRYVQILAGEMEEKEDHDPIVKTRFLVDGDTGRVVIGEFWKEVDGSGNIKELPDGDMLTITKDHGASTKILVSNAHDGNFSAASIEVANNQGLVGAFAATSESYLQAGPLANRAVFYSSPSSNGLLFAAGHDSANNQKSGDIRFFTGDVFNVNIVDQLERMIITNKGNIGIGTSTPAQTLSLAIDGNIGAEKYCDEYGNNCQGIDEIGGGGYWAADGINIHNTNTGNVGIGIDDPTEKLSIKGNIHLTDYKKIMWGGKKTWIEGENPYNILRFATNDNVRMIINQYGNVGIGTNDPKARLHVRDAGVDYTAIRIENTESTAGIWELRSIQKVPSTPINSLNNGFGIFDATALVQKYRFVINKDGEVGIGTNDPQANFHLETVSSSDTLNIENVNSDSTEVHAKIQITRGDDKYNMGLTSNNNDQIILAQEDGSGRQAFVVGDSGVGQDIFTAFGFSTSLNEGKDWHPRLIIKQDGQIGIGTNEPKKRLHVKGGPVWAEGGLIIETRKESDSPPAEVGRMWLVVN